MLTAVLSFFARLIPSRLSTGMSTRVALSGIMTLLIVDSTTTVVVGMYTKHHYYYYYCCRDQSADYYK